MPRRRQTKRAPRKPLLRRLAAGAGRALKKRYTRKGNLNVSQIAKDVMMLKSVINSEKKRTTLGAGSFESAHFCGQVNGSSSGHQILDISPSSIAQGTDYNQRTGNSIKLHSLVIKGQFIQMTNTSQKVRVSVDIFMRKTDVASPAKLLAEVYSLNPFPSTPVLDYHSVRNPDFYGDYMLLASRRLYVASDTVSPQTNACVNYTIPIKFGPKVHAKWTTAGAYESVQIFYVVRLDSGNQASTASSIVNIPTGVAETGLFHVNQWQYFYYDN